MTDLNHPKLMFASGLKDGLQVELPTASFQDLHRCVGGVDGTVDLVTIELTNRTAGPLDYTIGWGGTANKDLIIGTLATKSGVVVAVNARPLARGQVVSAKASGAGINAYAKVARYSP